MYDRNWQWEADPHNFQEETKLYNGIRAADLSELFSPSKIKQQNKRNIAKLTQSHYHTEDNSQKQQQKSSKNSQNIINQMNMGDINNNSGQVSYDHSIA